MFTLPPSLPLGGPTARYHHNVEALRVLKALRDRSAAPGGATDLERGALCLYSGWGDTAVLKLAASSPMSAAGTTPETVA